ncbi:12286_t:CDS:2 [Rhizophagus irregularis]|nr:12286_t:CDS:2 [Rhizophagus irregularis]
MSNITEISTLPTELIEVSHFNTPRLLNYLCAGPKTPLRWLSEVYL